MRCIPQGSLASTRKHFRLPTQQPVPKSKYPGVTVNNFARGGDSPRGSLEHLGTKYMAPMLPVGRPAIADDHRRKDTTITHKVSSYVPLYERPCAGLGARGPRCFCAAHQAIIKHTWSVARPGVLKLNVLLCVRSLLLFCFVPCNPYCSMLVAAKRLTKWEITSLLLCCLVNLTASAVMDDASMTGGHSPTHPRAKAALSRKAGAMYYLRKREDCWPPSPPPLPLRG